MAEHENADFRNDLRSQLVTTGTAAAEQWLATRANRRMSDVNRRRLAGHIVNALWADIENAAIGIAEFIADDNTVKQLRAELDAANELAHRRATLLDKALTRQVELAEERNAANEKAEKAKQRARLLLVGQNELDRQRAETDAVTHAEFEAAMNELRAQRDEARTTAGAYLATLERFADEDEDSLRAERDEARARLAELGEASVEWGYWGEDGFNVSEGQFSAGDVRYYRDQSGRPVERRLVGEWREVAE